MMNAVIRVGVCVCAAIIVWALLCKYYFREQTNPHYQLGDININQKMFSHKVMPLPDSPTLCVHHTEKC